MLSSEVGFLKADPRIFQIALERLGAGPESAVFVDDKIGYCRAAQALGMSAVQLVRHPGPNQTAPLPEDHAVVTSFTDLDLW